MSEITTLDKARFDEAYSIMEKSFPPDEIRPYGGQKSLLLNKFYRVYTLVDSGRICSVAATWQFDGVLFIEHLATNPDLRGKGMGAQMLDFLTKNEKRTVCLEVEPPENELTCRRIAFYERKGFNLNEYPYIQPSISLGRSPIPLMIMTHSRKIDESEFDTIKHLLYKEVYKVI